MLFELTELDTETTTKYPFLKDKKNHTHYANGAKLESNPQWCQANNPNGAVDLAAGKWAECGMIDLGGRSGVVWPTGGSGYGWKDPYTFFKYLRPVKEIRSIVDDFLAIANLAKPLLVVHHR
jgi:hypothetical protein